MGDHPLQWLSCHAAKRDRLVNVRWKSGTGSGRWPRWLVFADGASIAWPIATSSTGWCGSRARSRTTGIAMNCSRQAASVWPSMRWRAAWATWWQGVSAHPGTDGEESESKVDEALRTLLHQSDEPISAENVEALLGVASSASRRDVKIAAIDLSIFDRLYTEVVQ
jgi:hypothetical protein